MKDLLKRVKNKMRFDFNSHRRHYIPEDAIDTSPICNMPRELIREIMDKLESLHDKLAFCHTCKDFFQMAKSICLPQWNAIDSPYMKTEYLWELWKDQPMFKEAMGSPTRSKGPLYHRNKPTKLIEPYAYPGCFVTYYTTLRPLDALMAHFYFEKTGNRRMLAQILGNREVSFNKRNGQVQHLSVVAGMSAKETCIVHVAWSITMKPTGSSLSEFQLCHHLFTTGRAVSANSRSSYPGLDHEELQKKYIDVLKQHYEEAQTFAINDKGERHASISSCPYCATDYAIVNDGNKITVHVFQDMTITLWHSYRPRGGLNDLAVMAAYPGVEKIATEIGVWETLNDECEKELCMLELLMEKTQLGPEEAPNLETCRDKEARKANEVQP